MKLVILEGPIDLQFFKSFVIKQMKGEDITKKSISLIEMFRNLLAENQEMARIEILSINDNTLILLSAGSKSNFKIIAKGIKPLIDVLRKKGQNVNSILFVADKDAESEVAVSKEIIKEKFGKEYWRINVSHILYCNYLEDLILEIVEIITKRPPDNINTELLKSLLSTIEKQYNDDKYLYKRKVGIVHAVIGPRCFGHLFDEIFQFFSNLDYLLQHIGALSEFTEWVNRINSI